MQEATRLFNYHWVAGPSKLSLQSAWLASHNPLSGLLYHQYGVLYGSENWSLKIIALPSRYTVHASTGSNAALVDYLLKHLLYIGFSISFKHAWIRICSAGLVNT